MHVLFGKDLPKALAIALMLWFAGTGCLIVSYAQASTTSKAEAETSESADASAGMASHKSCHAAQQRSNQQAAEAKSGTAGVDQISFPAPSRSDAMNCCPLTSRSIATASRVQVTDDHKSAPAAGAANDRAPSSASSRAPLDVPLRLPNQDRKSTRLNSSHGYQSRMPSSA